MSALGALLVASPAAAAPSGPIREEGPLGAAVRQPDQSSAVDADGDAVAVWQSTDGTNFFEEASVRPAGGDWSAPVQISEDATLPGFEEGEPTIESSVAFGPNGEIVAAWSRPQVNDHQIEAATLSSIDGTWSTPVKLTDGTTSAFSPDVAIGPEGTAIAVWNNSYPAEEIEFAELPQGGQWTPAEALAGSETTYAPTVKFDRDGNALMVWTGTDSATSKQHILSSYRPADGTFEAPVAASPEAPEVDAFSFAFDREGDATMVYTYYPGSIYRAEVTELAAGSSTWSAAENLDSTGIAEPQIAVDREGDALVAWTTYGDGELQRIQTRSRPAGGSWGATQTVATIANQQGYVEKPHLAMGDDGTAMVSWEHFDGNTFEIEGSVRVYEASWRQPVQLSEPGANEPELTGNEFGEAVGTFYEEGELQAYVYDPAAPRLISYLAPQEAHVGELVTAEVEVADMDGVEVEWEFGDGTTATGDKVTHTYAEAGEYFVQLNLIDGFENGAISGGPITITVPTVEPPAETPGGGGTTTTGSTTTTTTTTSTTGFQSTTTSKPAAPKTTPDWLRLAQVDRDKPVGDGALVLKAPGKGTIKVFGPGVKTTVSQTKGKGAKVTLQLTPRGAFAKRLAGSHHRGYTEVTIVYTPADGGATVKATRRVRLVKR